MGSSGVIYAIIVGAWAVYLVPMWLRREDELNRARETQRYAAAIKVLAHKEAFERRWAQSDESDQALPLAAGQSFVPSRRVMGPRLSGPWRPPAESTAPASGATPAKRTSVAAASKPATRTTSKVTATATATAHTSAPNARGNAKGAAATTQKYPAPRTGLMARRRRVVGALFALTTFGALISADLGVGYVWAMVLPAMLLSVYIVRLRRDERVRATARARRRAAAQLAREAREAREAHGARDADGRGRDEIRAQEAHALADAYARAEEQAQAQAATETEQTRRQAARRRSSAAARARAQSYAQETPDLPRASNG